MHQNVRWIHTGPLHDPHSQDDPRGHGSCVASKAAGLNFGTAKKATLVVVKINPRHWGSTTATIQGLAAAALDIMQHALEGKAVVCFAHTIVDIPYIVPTGMPPTLYGRNLFRFMNEMFHS
jgi:hypothetical protein